MIGEDLTQRREDAEDAKGKGKELLITRLSLNKMNLESKTLILHTTTLRTLRLRVLCVRNSE